MKIVYPHSVQSCFWMMPHDCLPDDDKCDGNGLLPDGVPDGKDAVFLNCEDFC